jgi:hypothetical protein
MGYSPINKQIDYITKKNGTLDMMGYTKSTTDYPLSVSINEYGQLEFITISQVKEEVMTPYIINDRNYKIKYPVKAFHRSPESEKDMYLDGTFYEVENTHGILYSVFEEIISDENLGVPGFFVYGYLKHCFDIFKNGYQISLERMHREIGFQRELLNRVTKRLAFRGLISIENKQFNIDLNREDWEANIYIVNDVS